MSMVLILLPFIERLLLISLLILYPFPALSTELETNLSSIYRYYDEEYNPETDQEWQPLGQYLEVNLTGIAGRNITFTSLTRGMMDLSGDREFMDFLTATLIWKDILGKVDLHVGRQYILEGQGFESMDGLKVALNNIGPFSLDFWGGLPVRRLRERDREKGDNTWGGRISLTQFQDTTFAISYARREHQSDLAEERMGIDLSQWLLKRFKIYGNFTYNLPLDQFDETLLGGTIYLTKDLGFSMEWTRYMPNFELEDIWNVFDIEPYDEYSGQIDLRLSSWLTLSGRYAKQIFFATPAADDHEDIMELRADIFLSDKAWFSLSSSLQEGFGGMRRGIELDGYKYLYRDILRLEGGINFFNYNYSRFKQGFQDFRKDEEDFSIGSRVGLLYKFRDLWDFRFEFNNYNNKFFNNQIMALAIFNFYYRISF